ncbi:hypothetical protein BRD56_06395 [Thermoplasmatales archaeon SW_10_69_26]|nr:MAG: hypothetical protein BRD56_06395 [Thermoplasmatales archaeon SW_10_69_26]
MAEDEAIQPPVQPNVPGEGIHSFNEVVPGLAKREVAQAIAGDTDVDDLLEAARVVCFRGEGFPRVDDHTGHILCPTSYTREQPPIVVYLDLAHELVHVRQVHDGQQVYHFPEAYVDWPTEQEAYRITYEEAKRLGLSDEWFWRYLSVPWIEDTEIATLARAIGMPESGIPTGEEREDSKARH